MPLNRREPAPILPAEPVVDPIKKGFGVMLAIVGSMYIAARPLGFMHYSGETALGALLAICFVVLAGVAALRNKAWRVPESLVLGVVLWTAIFVWGALRSPYLGEGIPLASDAIMYGLLLLAGYFAGRVEPALRVILVRAIIAMVAVEAVFSTWQVLIELPRLRRMVASGEAVLPEALLSKIGLDRLYGDNAQGTFGNPNLLAGYLVVGFLLLMGHSWDSVWGRAREYLFPKLYRFMNFVDPIWERAKKHLPPVLLRISVPFEWIWGRTKKHLSQEIHSNIKDAQTGWGLSLLCVSLAVLMLTALYLTGSKGGGAALVAGLWFFMLQRLSGKYRILKTLTANAISGGVLILGLATADRLPSKPFGLSLQVRFDYWKSGLAMFWRHPLQGVGLGGYGEWYNYFKTPMGTEVRDPHNEYVCLLAELGILGLLIYVALWRMILARTRVTEFKLAGGTPAVHGTTPAIQRSGPWLLNMDLLSGVFGALCLWFAIFALGVFNAADIISMLQGEFSRAVLAGSVQTLFLPVVFGVVVVLLRTDAKVHARESGVPVETSPTLVHGFRAAAGAILLHQLVDFDFKAQAVMGALFLCGGMFLAAADAGREAQSSESIVPAPPSLLSRAGVWVAIACALLLIPTGVWVPLQSGLARQNAEETLSDYKQLLAHPERASTVEPEQLERQVLAACRRAAEAAPYDAASLVALADAKFQFERPRPGSNDEDAVVKILEKALRLRPLSPSIMLTLGMIHFRRGMSLAAESELRSRVQLELALEKFSEARRVYPLRPAHALMEGDVLIDLARSEEACSRYLQAFEIDMAINDPNVFLSSVFTDPRPGAFVNHDQNLEVVQTISRLLLTEQGTAQRGSLSRMGLLVRRVTGLAQVIDEARRYGRRTQAELEGIEQQKSQLVRTTRELLEIAPEGPMRAHAALLHALCLRHTHMLAKDLPEAEGEADWKRRCEEAAKLAEKLQVDSVKLGKPGTVPRLFDELIKVARDLERKK